MAPDLTRMGWPPTCPPLTTSRAGLDSCRQGEVSEWFKVPLSKSGVV